MKLPSVSEYMAKLASNPQVAAEFAAATPGRSRLEAVTACHKLATTTLAELAANKRKLVIARAKIAALEAAKLTNARLRSSLAAKRTRQATPPATLETAAAKFSRLQKTEPLKAGVFYQENRLEILRSTPTK